MEYDQLQTEARRANLLKPEIRKDAWDMLRMAAFDLERRIKSSPPLGMPVDTGRAKNSWGHSQPPASAADGIWVEDQANLTILEGSRVEYIEALNEGHSLQSPAGFIDRANETVADILDKAIEAYLMNETPRR